MLAPWQWYLLPEFDVIVPPRSRALQLLNEKSPKLALELCRTTVEDPKTGENVRAIDLYLDGKEKWFRKAWGPLVEKLSQRMAYAQAERLAYKLLERDILDPST